MSKGGVEPPAEIGTAQPGVNQMRIQPSNIRQEQFLHDIWLANNTPQWVLEAEAQEEGWVTDDDDQDDYDQCAATDSWTESFEEIPF
jgi:hypothetical protein